MKYNTIFTFATLLVVGIQGLFAQNACDTCFIGLHIESKTEPFTIVADANGNASGVISIGLNGDIYLYTNRPIVKVVNQSSSDYRNKVTGEYRVIMFDCGHATTYDFVRQKDGSPSVFQPKGVKNFQNSIYFSGDLQQNRMYFQLENNEHFRRYLQIRNMSGEFGGIDKIQVTVATAGEPDSVYTYGDNGRQDTIVLYPGQSIKQVSAARYSNGVLNAISFNEQKLPGQFTFRNSSVISETDRLTARSATLTTTDTTLALVGPGVLSIEYSFMEGDGNSQSEKKSIEVLVGVREEESSNAWIWWLLILLVAGGAGGYYYRRYQLKKRGVIPETDAEKVARLTKVVASHENIIKELRQVESGLLSDKKHLQDEVLTLNQDHAAEVKRLNDALQSLKNENLEKAAESNGYHNQLNLLQKHTDEVQANLDEARRQIAVYESGEEQKEIKRLNEQIDAIKEAHEHEMAAAEARKQQQLSDMVAANEAKMKENLYECESRITAVNSEKENAVAAITAEKEAIEHRLTAEKAEAIAVLSAEKEEAVAAISAEKQQAVSAAEADRDAKVQAAEEDRDAKVKLAESERDAKVQAVIADRDAQVAAVKAEKEAEVNRLIIEKDDAIGAAISEKEQAIGIAITEKEEAIAAAEADRDQKIAEAVQKKEEAVAAALAEKNIAVTAANEERDRAVKEAQIEKENAINAMSIRQNEEIALERAKTAEAVAVIKTLTSEYIAYLDRSVDAIVLQINTMQQEVIDSRYENNYTNVISHLSQKVLEFERWFKREIVAGQQEHTWSVNDVKQVMQSQMLPLLNNNYTWVSEMVRFTAYCGISRQFKDQFHKSGVPTDYLRNAYAETVSLYGRMGITLLVPSLFADDFNPDCHKLNNAPLINSFFPHTFMEYKPESKGMIYDVLRPGYSLEGEIKQLPEVCVY